MEQGTSGLGVAGKKMTLKGLGSTVPRGLFQGHLRTCYTSPGLPSPHILISDGADSFIFQSLSGPPGRGDGGSKKQPALQAGG